MESADDVITSPNAEEKSGIVRQQSSQHADLTVELGFSSDMGVTNSRYPKKSVKDKYK